jgi:Ca2+-binding EF-hand superfamily protein
MVKAATSDTIWNDMMAEVDTNGDGVLSFEEFE